MSGCARMSRPLLGGVHHGVVDADGKHHSGRVSTGAGLPGPFRYGPWPRAATVGVVKRTLPWSARFRQLAGRCERRVDMLGASHRLAAALICPGREARDAVGVSDGSGRAARVRGALEAAIARRSGSRPSTVVFGTDTYL